MATHHLQPDSPFHAWRLSEPGRADPAPYPVTMSLSQEGPNRVLYLTPTSLPSLGRALRFDDDDLAVLLDLGTGVQTCRWGELEELRGVSELLHVPRRQGALPATLDELPSPLLAAPELALPRALGSQAALCVHDGCHGAVIARAPEVIARCLVGFLTEYVRAQTLAPEVPTLTPQMIAPLLAPQAPGCWHNLSFQAGRRYWTLDAHEQGGTGRTFRLVCEAERGRWRAGWSWT